MTDHDELKQQIPDDLKADYRDAGTSDEFYYNWGQVREVIERIAKAEFQLKTVLYREAASQKRHDDKVDALEAKLAGARKEALEEAATLADRLELYKGVTVAREIRALIAKEPANPREEVAKETK